MGLDHVEMVVRIEQDFALNIPNDIAATFVTPRLVIDYLMTRREIATVSSRETVALKLWFLLEDQLSIDRYSFNEDSRFLEDMGVD